MILTCILGLILIFAVAIMVLAISATGAIGIIVFGDVIVCCFILGFLIKRLLRKK